MFNMHTKKIDCSFEIQDHTIHGGIFQSCKFFQDFVNLVLLQLVLALKVAQLVLNSLQQ